MIYKFPEKNRRIEKLTEKARRIILKAMQSNFPPKVHLSLQVTRIKLSPDLANVKVGLARDTDLANIVDLMNHNTTYFNKELIKLGTKRTPKCRFVADQDYLFEQRIIHSKPSIDDDQNR